MILLFHVNVMIWQSQTVMSTARCRLTDMS